jgi:hypothetical protein
MDPPYGILPDVEWDKQAWPFEKYKKTFSEILKVNTEPSFTIAVFGTEKNASDVYRAFEEVGIKDYFCVIWFKKNAHGQQSSKAYPRLVPSHEHIFFGCRGGRAKCTFIYSAHPDHRRNVWEFPVTNKSEYICDHDIPINPAQKPLRLLRALLFRHAYPKNRVLDLCSGTGTTAVAAASLGMDCVSVELDTTQVPFIEARLRSTSFSVPPFNEPAEPFSQINVPQETSEEAPGLCECKKVSDRDSLTTCMICTSVYCSDCLTNIIPGKCDGCDAFIQ